MRTAGTASRKGRIVHSLRSRAGRVGVELPSLGFASASLRRDDDRAKLLPTPVAPSSTQPRMMAGAPDRGSERKNRFETFDVRSVPEDGPYAAHHIPASLVVLPGDGLAAVLGVIRCQPDPGRPRGTPRFFRVHLVTGV